MDEFSSKTTCVTTRKIKIQEKFLYEFSIIRQQGLVQTKTILFLKSMSERIGSEIERLLNWISKLKINRRWSRSMSDPFPSDLDFKNKMAWVWTTLDDFGSI